MSTSRPDRPLALVTGASRGIGLAIAATLAPTHRLRLVARRLESLETAAASLREGAAGVDLDIESWPCDLADADARRALCGKAAEADVDVLINNAGIARSAPIHRTSDEDWSALMAINLTAPFELTRAVLGGMKKRGWGRIVNIASTASLKGYRYTAAYNASKHGLLGLTRGAALDVASNGITINAICPGFTATDMVQAAVDNISAKTGRSEAEARQELASINPQGRLIEPDEVAAMVAYLVTEAARGIHGQALAIDGGDTA